MSESLQQTIDRGRIHRSLRLSVVILVLFNPHKPEKNTTRETATSVDQVTYGCRGLLYGSSVKLSGKAGIN